MKKQHAGISPHDASVFFEEILGKGADLRVRVTGGSMYPFLKGGEMLLIRKTPCHGLRRGDIIFFRDTAGTPVLHRIVRKKRDVSGSYVFLTKGDALSACDAHVPERQVLGKVFKIEKTGKGGKPACVDMESFPRMIVNYFIAAAGLAESRIRLLPVKLKLFTGKSRPEE